MDDLYGIKKILKITKHYLKNGIFIKIALALLNLFLPFKQGGCNKGSVNKGILLFLVITPLVSSYLLTQTYLQNRSEAPPAKNQTPYHFSNQESLQALENFKKNKEKLDSEPTNNTLKKHKNSRKITTKQTALVSKKTKKANKTKEHTQKITDEVRFKTINEAKREDESLVTIGPLWFVREELNNCIKKCTLKVKDKNSSTTTLIFFKSAFSEQFKGVNNKIMIKGRLNSSGDQIFLSKIYKIE